MIDLKLNKFKEYAISKGRYRLKNLKLFKNES